MIILWAFYYLILIAGTMLIFMGVATFLCCLNPFVLAHVVLGSIALILGIVIACYAGKHILKIKKDNPDLKVL